MGITFEKTIPILRSFDEGKAKAFYVDYLGCRVDWEHRFEPGMPLFMSVSRGDLVLYLSEHHGDATPGSSVHIEMTGVRALHAELATRGYRSLNPGINPHPLGISLNLTDPFGSKLNFIDRSEAGENHSGG